MSVEWLFEKNGIGNFLAALVLSAGGASIAGFIKGVKGYGLFMTHVAGSCLTAVVFPVVQDYYGPRWGLASALACGVIAWAVFLFFIKFTDRVQARGDQIADGALKKFVPEIKDPA